MDRQNLNEKIEMIKNWLDTGSLNIFGLPMSGKDTVGMRLAEDLQAKFLSSGIIIRAYEAEQNEDMTGSGKLIPTNTFYDIILPYFSRKELQNDSLILSSVGRWSGEEDKIMEAARAGGHEIKAVIMLDLTEEEVKKLADLDKKADEAYFKCKKIVKRLLPEMNLVIGEYTFDEGKLIFYFTANNRLDFRELVKEVNKTFKKRVEFYQIKTNDEGRILSAFGKYGREIYW